MTLEEILSAHKVPTRQPGESKDVRQGFIGLHCPYCGRPDDKFYLGWNLARRYFSCWSCGWLPAPKTLAELTGLPLFECRKLLGEMPAGESGPGKSELRGRYVEPAHVSTMEMAHRNYLRGRGLKSQTIEKLWGVRGIGLAAKLAWRLFIPIAYRDRPVSWTTRAIGNIEPRYISAPPECEIISQRELLYGGDMVSHAAIVVEGPADCWAIGPGAVGLLGIGFSAAQVLKLSRIPRRMIVFDNEPAAQLRARQLCEQLAPFPGETVNATIDAKDPAAAGAAEIRQLRRFLE